MTPRLVGCGALPDLYGQSHYSPIRSPHEFSNFSPVTDLSTGFVRWFSVETQGHLASMQSASSDTSTEWWNSRALLSQSLRSCSQCIPGTFECQLHPITLATQGRTLIDCGLQNGGLFTFFVYINSRKYYNKGFDSKLARKLLYCESITKSKKTNAFIFQPSW